METLEAAQVAPVDTGLQAEATVFCPIVTGIGHIAQCCCLFATQSLCVCELLSLSVSVCTVVTVGVHRVLQCWGDVVNFI